jgi:hypothetical protein
MKIEVLPGRQIVTGNKTYGPGETADYAEAEAKCLIELGAAKELGEPESDDDPDNPPSPPLTPEEKAAKKRQKAEAAAVKKGLGTAEEVAKLTDEELAKLFKGTEQ